MERRVDVVCVLLRFLDVHSFVNLELVVPYGKRSLKVAGTLNVVGCVMLNLKDGVAPISIATACHNTGS